MKARKFKLVDTTDENLFPTPCFGDMKCNLDCLRTPYLSDRLKRELLEVLN